MRVIKSISYITLVTGLILFIPLAAMQFTDEVNWNLDDFVIMGMLLFVTGLVIDLAMRRLVKPLHRYIVIAFITIVFFLIWIELAVGILGTPFAGS